MIADNEWVRSAGKLLRKRKSIPVGRRNVTFGAFVNVHGNLEGLERRKNLSEKKDMATCFDTFVHWQKLF